MRATLVKLLATSALGWSLLSRPDPDVAEGNRLYQEGKYSEAVEAYKKATPRTAAERRRIAFNRGTALLKAGEYGAAREALREAQGDDEARLRLAASFNEGNAALLMKDYRAAASAYRRALQVDPGHEPARRNLELALLAMERPDAGPHDAKQPEGGPANDGASDANRDAARDAGPDSGTDGGADGAAGDSTGQGDGSRGNDSGGGDSGNSGGDGSNPRGQDGGGQDGGGNEGGATSQQQRRPQPEQREITEQDALRLLDSLRDAEQDRLLMRFLDREAQPEQVEKNW